MYFSSESPMSVGLTERILAYIIDSIFLASLSTLVLLSVRFATSVEGFHLGILDFLIILLLAFSYYVFIPLFWNGYTVGKRIMGIRIVSIAKEGLTFTQTLTRGIFHGVLYMVFGILAIISLIFIVVRDDNRTLHEFVSSTYVGYRGVE